MNNDEHFHHFVLRTITPEPLAPLSDHQLETMLDQAENADDTPLPPNVLAALSGAEKKPRSPTRAVWAIAAAVALLAGIVVWQNRDNTAESPSVVEQKLTPAPVLSGETIRIALDFPKPLFVGTPVKAERANLETPDPSKIVHEIIAPAGTSNLALNKPITSSDEEPIIGELAMVADGDKDGADGSYVELGPDMQWVQIDLEKNATLYAIVLWHFHKNARAYDDVIVQLSDNPDFETGVTTVYNNDDDNSSSMGAGQDLAWIETNHGRVIPIDGKRARYVRLYSAGNTANEMNHYVEVEVYGQ
jgi:hypothetical protein